MSSSSSEEDFVMLCLLTEIDEGNLRLNEKSEGDRRRLTDKPEEDRKRKYKRKCWVREINQKREELGEFYNLFDDLVKNGQRFLEHFGMSYKSFCELHQLIGPEIATQNTRFRQAVPTKEKLAVCLRFLVTGDSFKSIALSYRLGKSTVRSITYSVCQALWKVLQPIVMPIPDQFYWERIEMDFRKKWNFPNCIGAIHGKHIIVSQPDDSSYKLSTYQKTFSMVLLGLVDANYKFIMVDIGAYDRNSDGGVFPNSVFGKKLLTNKLSIPDRKTPPDSEVMLPHVVVGNEAFALHENLMRPYPGATIGVDEKKKIFNFRLDRAWRVSQNCFGILSNKFSIFHKNLKISPQNLERVIQAACALHNFLIDEAATETRGMNIEPESTTNLFGELVGVGGRASTRATSVRDSFAEYFYSQACSVEWQYDMVKRECMNNTWNTFL